MSIKKRKILCLILVPVSIAFLLTGFFFIISTMPATGSCSGQVEGDSVRYVRNEVKYISLEELGIDPAEVTEGGSMKYIQDHRFDKGEILSLVKIYEAKRYETLTNMKVRIYDELHCKERTEKIWITSPEYDAMNNLSNQ